jgi:hypothetical protein
VPLAQIGHELGREAQKVVVVAALHKGVPDDRGKKRMKKQRRRILLRDDHAGGGGFWSWSCVVGHDDCDATKKEGGRRRIRCNSNSNFGCWYIPGGVEDS